MSYRELRRKLVFEVLEKYPKAGSLTLAKILKRDNPEFFKDAEEARNIIRIYRGAHGKQNRERIKTTKYFIDGK